MLFYIWNPETKANEVYLLANVVWNARELVRMLNAKESIDWDALADTQKVLSAISRSNVKPSCDQARGLLNCLCKALAGPGGRPRTQKQPNVGGEVFVAEDYVAAYEDNKATGVDRMKAFTKRLRDLYPSLSKDPVKAALAANKIEMEIRKALGDRPVNLTNVLHARGLSRRGGQAKRAREKEQRQMVKKGRRAI